MVVGLVLSPGSVSCWATSWPVPSSNWTVTLYRSLMGTRVSQNNVTGNINLQRDYTAWTCNRGQEADPCWLDAEVDVEYPVPPHLIRYTEGAWRQIQVNRAHRRTETDWFAPGTYRLAMEWLERNYRRESFFLWIDTFDPHEPWDPPPHYIDMYDPGYRGVEPADKRGIISRHFIPGAVGVNALVAYIEWFMRGTEI